MPHEKQKPQSPFAKWNTLAAMPMMYTSATTGTGPTVDDMFAQRVV